MNPVLPVFRPVSEAAAFAFLEQEAAPGDVVLASYGVSNALPAWAPVKVVSGHGPESINGGMINVEVNAFFESQPGPEKGLEFIQKYQIKFVFWGPEEKRLGNWDPQGVDYLRLVYLEDSYAIYEVIR